MIFEVRGGLGDEIAATAIVREYKRARPDEIVRVFEPSRPSVWLHNPHLNWGKHDGGAPGRAAGRFLLRMDSEDASGKSLPSGSVAHRHAAQVGIEIVDDTPELWLTKEERDAEIIKRPERTIALDIGAGWESKRWPYANWRKVIEALRADDWDVVGIGDARASAQDPGSPIPLTRDFYKQTSIRDLAVLLGQCALLLGHDSGPMHVAAAVGTPQVIVWGVTKWYNYGYYNTTSVFPYGECGENCYRECYNPPKVNGRFDHCLEKISVDRVLDAVRLSTRRWSYRPAELRPEARVGVPRRAWAPRPLKTVTVK